jgi:hypothetical protein
MENKEEEVFKCYKCDKSFKTEYYSLYELKSPPINDEYMFDQILEELLNTRLFCIKCSTNHATIICLKSKKRFRLKNNLRFK